MHLDCMSPDKQTSIAILADDLTSAADGVGPFVSRGLAAIVGRQVVPAGTAAVRAIDVGSRSMDATSANRQTMAAAAELCASDVVL